MARLARAWPWLVSLGAASCPELGKEELFACQTDVELGSPSPSLPNAPSAFCTDHAKCVEIGLATGNCCPAMNGQYLSCCDATSRRLTPQRMDKKGVTIDDTTLQWCSSRIPETWPNLKAAPMGSLRIFQTWNSQWPSKGRHTSWKGLVDFVKANRLKVLVGTPVTCVEGEDEITWSWTKEFLQMVGPEHVMGLAVGNELELLYTHADSGCISEMWTGGRLWSVFQRRVAEFDKLGFRNVPVTSVFTASVLTDSTRTPFMEKADQGLINTFLKNAYQKYGRRYAFTFNVYPYFDPGVHLNPGSTDQCSLDLPRVICWEGSTCLGPNIMAAARRQISRMTGRLDDLFWIGEIGWSSPKASALGTAMAECEQFSSLDTFKTFYNGFLQWNLDVPGSLPGPDHAFYFTLRDALNFGKQEHFGLITSCESLACKIAKPDFRGEICPLASLQQGLSWQAWGFVGLGVLLAVCTGLTCLFVRSPKVQKHFDRPQRIAKRRLVQADSSSSSE